MKTTVWFAAMLLTVAFITIDSEALEQAEPALAALESRLTESPGPANFVAYAYQANPSIRKARESWRATVEKYRIATGLPDPQLMVTYFPEPIETRLGPQDWNAVLSQTIPFPGKLIKSGELVEADAQMAKLKLDQAVRDVVVALRESYHELAYIRKAREVARQNSELLDHIRKVTETAYAGDRATLVDVVKAQSQVGQIRYDAILLDDLEQTEIARINGLLNRAPDAAVGSLQEIAIQPMAYTLDEIYRLAESAQEEIRIADIQTQKAETRIDLARYEGYPDFKVGLFYAGIGQPDVPNRPSDSGDDAVGIQLGLSLPLWFGKNSGRIASARAEMREAEAARQLRVTETRTQIRALFFRLENARRIITLYQDDLLPQAAESMELAETWFQEGESGFTDFVEAQSVWYNFQLALARSRADYGKFLARLERLVGRSLTEKTGTIEDPSVKEGEQ